MSICGFFLQIHWWLELNSPEGSDRCSEPAELRPIFPRVLGSGGKALARLSSSPVIKNNLKESVRQTKTVINQEKAENKFTLGQKSKKNSKETQKRPKLMKITHYKNFPNEM